MAATAKKNNGVKAVTWPLAAVRRRGKILLRRRSAGGILAGLWELPGGELGASRSIRTCLRNHLGVLNGNLKFRRRIGELRHGITNRRIRAPVFLFDVRPETDFHLPEFHWRWVSPDSVRAYPVSSMTQKALRILAAHEKSFL